MKIGKKQLIDIIAKTEGVTKANVSKVYKALERNIFDLLSSITPENDKDNPMVIKIFNGMSLEGYYLPSHEKVNNLSQEKITVKNKIKVKIDMKNYNRKLNKN